MGFKYTPDEYITWLIMSERKHLLVEGRDDKRVFQFALHEFSVRNNHNAYYDDIDIDCADDLIKSEASNYRRIEVICERIKGTSHAHKIVGFVDRGFREFSIQGGLVDKLKKHNIIDRLIWSRGHSIENYHFDFNTLLEPLREHSDIDHFGQAIDLFRLIFDSTLYLACAVSLTLEALNKLTKLNNCVDWTVLEIANKDIVISIDSLKRKLVESHNISVEETNLFIQKYMYYSSVVKLSNIECARWACHGHVGFKIIWAAYGRCVYKIYEGRGELNPHSSVQKVLGAKENIRFRACINSWVRRALANATDYPKEIFEFLGII